MRSYFLSSETIPSGYNGHTERVFYVYVPPEAKIYTVAHNCFFTKYIEKK